MTDNEVIYESMAIFKDRGLQYLVSHGFLDTMKCKIALVKLKFDEYQKNGIGVMQSITNCSIDFDISEGTVKRYVYEIRHIRF